MSTIEGVSSEEIARRAYELWQARGCPQGDPATDWQAAEAELRAVHTWRGSSLLTSLQNWWQRRRTAA